MKKSLNCIITLALLLILPVAALQGQPADDRAALSCDATLVTLLLVAINDYGYQPPRPLGDYALGPYSDQRISAGVDAPTVRQQAEARVAEAARAAEREGFPGVARELEGISDAVGELAEAGEALLEAGEAAFEAGRAAFESSDEPRTMSLGALPDEAAACTELRQDLVNFLFVHLTAAGAE